MRALIVGALGLSLVGCSHPQSDFVSCASPNDPTCAAAPRAQQMWVKAPYVATDARPARAEPSSVHARIRLGHRLGANTEKRAGSAMQVASNSHTPLPPDLPRRLAVSAAMAKAEDKPPAAPPEPRTIRPPVAVATAGAEPLPPPLPSPGPPPAAPAPKASILEGAEERADRIEPKRNIDAAKPTSVPSDNADLLVAIVMARPDTKSVSDLTGKTVAIDDRYAKSSGMVRTAIVAAGAPKVQMSEGSIPAINRLTNGEVPAAVVALVAPDATETFPDIKGFAIFHVPLSPRAARAR